MKATTNPTYGSPAFVVPRKQSRTYRIVVDIRKLDKYTKPSALVMHKLEEQLTRAGFAPVFGSFDVFSGFDYLP